MEKLNAAWRLHRYALMDLARNIAMILGTLATAVAAWSYVSVYAALLIVIAWLELARQGKSTKGVEVALAAAPAVVLFFVFEEVASTWVGLIHYRFARPTGLAVSALLIGVAYTRYRMPAQAAAILLLSWGALINLLSKLGQTCCIPKMYSKEYAGTLYFYNNFWDSLFLLAFALPMSILAIYLDKTSKAETGEVSEISTALYVIVMPCLFWALLASRHPALILHPTTLYYQLPLAILLWLTAAYAALLLDRRAILLWVSAAFFLPMLSHHPFHEHLPELSVAGSLLLVLHLYWSPVRRFALQITQAVSARMYIRGARTD